MLDIVYNHKHKNAVSKGGICQMKKSELYKQKREEGFTIIEVMIVLAIAGLIMVIVFIAIPQLQRNQRDNARKSVINRIKAEVDNYSSNNNGNIPTANNNATTGFVAPGGGFYARYINNNASQFQEPTTGAAMSMVAWTSDAAVATAALGTVSYATGRICQNEASIAGSARQYVIMSELEGGAIYCLDNR